MRNIYDEMIIDGKTWYACGALRSKKWAEKHAQAIKKAGGEYKIIKSDEGDFQVFTNSKKFARIGTIFENTENNFPALSSERSLMDWVTPEEEEAWKNLRKKKPAKTKTKRKPKKKGCGCK